MTRNRKIQRINELEIIIKSAFKVGKWDIYNSAVDEIALLNRSLRRS